METLRADLWALTSQTHLVVPYTSSLTDTWDVLAEADADPDHPGYIVDILQNSSFPVQYAGNTYYNRDHTWPRAYGLGDSEADTPAFSDMHHLFLSDIEYNSYRGSRAFGECGASCPWSEFPTVPTGGSGGSGLPEDSSWATAEDGGYGTWDMWWERRGDAARAILYMDVRYEGGTHWQTGQTEPGLVLPDDRSLIASTDGSPAYFGELSTALLWHAEDPPDARERQHNDAVFVHQDNRNPFVDHPEWVDCAFLGVCD